MAVLRRHTLSLSVLLIFVGAFVALGAVHAAPADELQEKIDTRSAEIKALEEEIERYERDLTETSKEARTLETVVSTYNTTIKKFTTDITLTNHRIESETEALSDLGSEITDKEKRIGGNAAALAEMIRALNAAETTSLVEMVLSDGSLASFWDRIYDLERFQVAIRQDLTRLRDLRVQLQAARDKAASAREALVVLNKQLSGKKAAVEANKQEKNKLLAVTKSQEKNFQSILEEKRAQKKIFEQEMFALESALKIAVDSSRLPEPNDDALNWPLDDVLITQYFGNTAFANRNPQIYGGKGHNGVDFAASQGTPIKAALAGVVEGSGNTDAVPGCYSYGKWILVKHANGLSTLYAHLSTITAEQGATVTTGEIIGYSGNTGYSTGPHLHFGVYASQGVRITKFTNSVNCKNAVIPIADLKAYLNPLVYLPK